jgi:hypothetical protein
MTGYGGNLDRLAAERVRHVDGRSVRKGDAVAVMSDVIDEEVPGAADLKFLHWLPQARVRNFKSTSGTRSLKFASAPFVSEVRVRGYCNVSRTSEAGH